MNDPKTDPETLSGIVERLAELLAGEKKDLAGEAGVSYASLHAWTSDRRRPTRRSVLRLARVARDRAIEISELADVLFRYVETGDIGDLAEERTGVRSLDSERLAQIQTRSRLLCQKARDTLEGIRGRHFDGSDGGATPDRQDDREPAGEGA